MPGAHGRRGKEGNGQRAVRVSAGLVPRGQALSPHALSGCRGSVTMPNYPRPLFQARVLRGMSAAGGADAEEMPDVPETAAAAAGAQCFPPVLTSALPGSRSPAPRAPAHSSGPCPVSLSSPFPAPQLLAGHRHISFTIPCPPGPAPTSIPTDGLPCTLPSDSSESHYTTVIAHEQQSSVVARASKAQSSDADLRAAPVPPLGVVPVGDKATGFPFNTPVHAMQMTCTIGLTAADAVSGEAHARPGCRAHSPAPSPGSQGASPTQQGSRPAPHTSSPPPVAQRRTESCCWSSGGTRAQ